MADKQKFDLIYAPEAIDHVSAIDQKYHNLIATQTEAQLSHTPEEETRNRKPVRQPAPFEATWELRLGPKNQFRVFYEVQRGEMTVWILAIGVKVGNRLFFGGKEFKP